MSSTALSSKVDNSFVYWTRNLSFVQKIIAALSMACITGVAAQICIPLPWTPVPITGQTFAVLLSGVVLGRFGVISQLFYLGIGALGMPWFAHGCSGATALIGPNGGYLIGFIAASFFLGNIFDKKNGSLNFAKILICMLFANIVCIYLPGLLQLKLWFALNNHNSLGLHALLSMGFLPFIGGDIIKIFFAAIAARLIIAK